MGVGRAPFKRSAPTTARGLRIGRRELGVRGAPNRSGAPGGGRCRCGLLQCSSSWRLARPGGGARSLRPRGLLIAGAHSADMAGWWPALSRTARRHPWPTNVLLYGSLVSAGDVLQQRLQGREADWRQTRRVATLVVTFHANFNYVWLGLLESALPGRAPHAVLAKLLCDQVVGAPIAVSAFYVGMSILQGKDDIFLDLKQKFWNTYMVSILRSPGEKNFNITKEHGADPGHLPPATGVCEGGPAHQVLCRGTGAPAELPGPA
nr:mpv17-like protein isoform X2 [Gorilla gorilla gorilla]